MRHRPAEPFPSNCPRSPTSRGVRLRTGMLRVQILPWVFRLHKWTRSSGVSQSARLISERTWAHFPPGLLKSVPLTWPNRAEALGLNPGSWRCQSSREQVFKMPKPA